MFKYQEEIDEFGFAAIPQIVDEEQIEKLIECLSKVNVSPGKKNGSIYGVRNILNLSPEVLKLAKNSEVKKLVEGIIGKFAQPVRAIFFDKTPDANWKVPWHQDLTIAIKEKRETAGFSVWTLKAKVHHVQPPVSILENMLTIRIHLDETDESNGALKVLPKSHKSGRLSAAEIQDLRRNKKVEVCRIERGGAFMMRPLLLHSSSAGTNPVHRRVIHIEFSAEKLPNGLEYYGS